MLFGMPRKIRKKLWFRITSSIKSSIKSTVRDNYDIGVSFDILCFCAEGKLIYNSSNDRPDTARGTIIIMQMSRRVFLKMVFSLRIWLYYLEIKFVEVMKTEIKVSRKKYLAHDNGLLPLGLVLVTMVYFLHLFAFLHKSLCAVPTRTCQSNFLTKDCWLLDTG